MTSLSEYVLTSVLNYGPLAIGLITFISGIGFPVPATMTLMAAGAFVQQGVLEWDAIAGLAAIGAIAGDNISYSIGRFGATAIPHYITSGSGWKTAALTFHRWGAASIFLTRFLLTPLALPINLLAGSTRYGLIRYASAVVAGEILWVVLFVGVGYVFADYWEAVNAMVSDISGLLVGILLAMISGIYLIRRYLQRKGRR